MHFQDELAFGHEWLVCHLSELWLRGYWGRAAQSEKRDFVAQAVEALYKVDLRGGEQVVTSGGRCVFKDLNRVAILLGVRHCVHHS